MSIVLRKRPRSNRPASSSHSAAVSSGAVMAWPCSSSRSRSSSQSRASTRSWMEVTSLQRGGGGNRELLAHHLGGRLVLAQPEGARGAQAPVARPLREADLGGERRLDPGHARLAHVLGERRGVPPQRREQPREPPQLLAAEAGAHLARVAQAPVRVVAEQERAEVGPA